MPRQFNEPRTKRPILNTATSLTFRPCHFERSRLPRRSYGEGGRNLLLLTADYPPRPPFGRIRRVARRAGCGFHGFSLVNFPRRISSAYWRSDKAQLFSCSFAKQKAAALRSVTADCEILLCAGSYNYW